MDPVLHFLPWLAMAVASYFLIPVLFRRRRRRLPPGPTPLPVIGNILDLGDQPHRSLARLAAIHGPLISLRLGAVTTVVASSPDMARAILRTHDASFSARSSPDAMRRHVPHSLPWLPPSQQWRGLRKLLTTELLRLDALPELRRRKVQEMLGYVQRLSERAEPVEIGRVAYTTAVNLMSQTIFSTDLLPLASSASHGFKDILTRVSAAAAAPNVSDFFPALASLDLQGLRRSCGEFLGELFAVFDELIEQRLQARAAAGSQSDKKDMLDTLLDLSQADDHTGIRMDRHTLRSLFTVNI